MPLKVRGKVAIKDVKNEKVKDSMVDSKDNQYP